MWKAVFLDLNEVIYRSTVREGKPYPPATLYEFEFLPGVVVTNHPDVRTGKQEREVVEAMHDRLRRATSVDDVYVCYRVDEDRCGYRKPLPGMLLAAAENG